MGLFSSIGKIIKGVAKPITGFLGANPWVSGALSAGGQFLASRSSAKDQMNYQMLMSNTAHQREMADLKAAGLNPILSSKYGGASTPSGSSYTLPSVADSTSSAASIPMKKAQVSNLIEQNNNLQSSSALQRAQATKVQLENDAFATLSPQMRAIVLSGGGVSSAAAAMSSIAKSGARGAVLLKNAPKALKNASGHIPFYNRFRQNVQRMRKN